MSKERRKPRGAGKPASAPPPPAPDPATTIVVGGESRRAERQRARQVKRRKRGAGVAAFVALGAVLLASGYFAFAHNQKKDTDKAAARTQRTLLFQVLDPSGNAVEAALLAHDPKDSTGAIVLVPTRVITEVPGRGSAPFGRAIGLGGAKLAEDALADLMGVTVDGSWVLSRAAFAQLVDVLGGVEVDVDTDVLAPAAGGTKVVVVRAGHQRLQGSAAVAFATYLADGEDELARQPRLQEVLDGLTAAAKAKGEAAVATAIKGLGAGSQLTTSPASDVARLLVGLAGDDLTEDILPVHEIDTGGPTAYGVDPTQLRTLVDNALADSVPASARGQNNRVLVQNGVGKPGIGESARTRLGNAGFVYRPGGNVPGFTFRTKPSVVLISDATQESIDLGQRVARALGLPVSDVKTSAEGQSVADVIVIIGADYKP
jgi:anionic cell wall polymer biosynthesis LytR-Cps2A-Psr (LCP) family protein